MNAVKKLAIVLSMGVLSGTAFAASTEKSYLAAYEKGPGVPELVKVVAPKVTAPAGSEVILEFVVDKTGVPRGITVASSNDSKLAEAAVKAVAEWRFTPVLKDGVTIDRKVKLPVRADAAPLSGPAFAALF